MKKILLPSLAFVAFTLVASPVFADKNIEVLDSKKALVVFHVTIKDQALFGQYIKLAAKTMQAYGGKPLIRGKFLSAVSGENDARQLGAVATFPNLASIDSWYKSNEYQAIVPIRDKAADVKIVKYVAATQ